MLSTVLPWEEVPDGARIVTAIERPQFVIQVWREWRQQWQDVEYGRDRRKTELRFDILARKEDAPMRILDREGD